MYVLYEHLHRDSCVSEVFPLFIISVLLSEENPEKNSTSELNSTMDSLTMQSYLLNWSEFSGTFSREMKINSLPGISPIKGDMIDESKMLILYFLEENNMKWVSNEICLMESL